MTAKQYELVSLEPITLAGITVRTENSATGFEKINSHWGRFFKEGVIEKIASKCDDAIYEAYFDYESDATGAYTLMLGACVEPNAHPPAGMSVVTLPRSRYAKFRIDDPKGVHAAWESIWARTDLDRSYTGDFEVFEQDAVELYVALLSD